MIATHLPLLSLGSTRHSSEAGIKRIACRVIERCCGGKAVLFVFLFGIDGSMLMMHRLDLC